MIRRSVPDVTSGSIATTNNGGLLREKSKITAIKSQFDDTIHIIDETDVEYWLAQELMPSEDIKKLDLAKMMDGSYQLIEVKGDNKIDDTVVKAKQAAAEEMAIASGMRYLMYAGSSIMNSHILD